MGHDAFSDSYSYKRPNIKLHAIILLTIVGVSVYLSTQVEKSKENTRVEALKVPVPLDSVFAENNVQQSNTQVAPSSVTPPVISESEVEYHFDSGPNLDAINQLLASEEQSTQNDDVAGQEKPVEPVALTQDENLQENLARSEREKDVAIMVVDDEVTETKPTQPVEKIEKVSEEVTTRLAEIKSRKKVGELDTVYELQQDRFLQTLAKTATVEKEESLEVKRMKEAIRTDKPLAAKSTVNSKPKKDNKIVKVVTKKTSGPASVEKLPNKLTVKSTTVTTQGNTVAKTADPSIQPKNTAPEIKEITLTRSELNNVLSQFARSYNKGDIQRLMALFDDNATTNDQKSKTGIKTEYAELFQSTTDRNIKIRNVQWDLGKGKARGDARFTVIVKPVGSNEAARIEGKLEILAVKENRGVFIKSLLHEVTVQ